MTTPAYTAEDHYRFGIQAAQARDLETAKHEFSTALGLDPDHVEARYKLGWVYGSQGELALALSEFQRVIELDPAHVEAHHNLGALLLQQAAQQAGAGGTLDLAVLQEAQAAFEAILKVEPYDQRAFALLRLIQNALQRYQGA